MRENIRSAIENLENRKKDVENYSDIMKRVWDVDVSSDVNFQRKFTHFYRLRRNDEFRKEYYILFEKCKSKPDLSFEFILRDIFEKTGRIEASFSSKMLATINPDMPIWDSIVLSKLNMKPGAYQDKEKRLVEAVELYREIEYWYKGFMQSEGSADFLNAFDEAFPEYQWFSSTKKVDFLLWGSGDANPLSQRVIEINGCVEVPQTVTADEFMDKFITFIEDNHWYFGGGVKEVKGSDNDGK